MGEFPLTCRPGEPGYIEPGSPEYRTVIGCSRIGKILGYGYKDGPYGPQEVWKYLTNRAPDPENKAIFDRGHYMEPELARLAKEKYGLNIVSEQVQYRDPDRPWLIAHVDGMVPRFARLRRDDPELEGAGVWEAKAPGSHVTFNFKDYGMTEEYTAQTQMGAYVASAALEMDILYATFGYLDYDAYDPICFNVPTSKPFQESTLEILDKFWWHVTNDKMPPHINPMEHEPPPQISGDRQLFEPEHELGHLARRLITLNTAFIPAKKEIEAVKGRMKEILDPYALAEIPGVMKFSYNVGKDRESYDGPGMLHYIEFLCSELSIDFDRDHWVTVKPGVRSFRSTEVKNG